METLQYQKEVKARKDHRCSFCFQRIPKGDKYNTSTHIYEGDIYNWKSHKHCDELAERMDMYKHADDMGVTSDQFQETVHEKYSDIMISIFPQEELQKYRDVIQELRYVQFRSKLGYVIRHFRKIDETKV